MAGQLLFSAATVTYRIEDKLLTFSLDYSASISLSIIAINDLKIFFADKMFKNGLE